MEEYSIEMNKSGIHLVNGEDYNNKSATANEFSETDPYDVESDVSTYSDQKVKKITTRSKSKVKTKSRTKTRSKTRASANNVKKNDKSKSKSNRNDKSVKDVKSSKANMKEAFKSIHTIESDVEHDNVKLTKKKLADREAELKRRQLPTCPASKAFRPGDIQRIVQHTNTSIFDKEKCALWTGYITNLQNKRKGTYVNFYFRNKKKVALHRLLFANFKGEICHNEYIKYSCANKGKCCNVNHMVKFEYNSAELEKTDVKDKKDKKNNSQSKQKNNKKKRSKSNRHMICEKDFKISIY
jgi:hypothetical protein